MAINLPLVHTMLLRENIIATESIKLKAHSQVSENLVNLKVFKSDQKCFLFQLKISFGSQGI